MAFFRPQLNEFGLTEQQWRIMRVLHEHDNLEFHELARLACVLPPSLTGMLTRLERKRLVRRRRAANDQRRLHVALTREGTERFANMSRHIERMYLVIECQLGKRRLTQLFSLLQRTQELQATAAAAAAAAQAGVPRTRSAA